MTMGSSGKFFWLVQRAGFGERRTQESALEGKKSAWQDDNHMAYEQSIF